MEIIVESGLLSPERELQLALAIEVGVFASHSLARGANPAGATEAELEHLVARGQSAFQEFFLANLRLVHSRAFQWSQRTGIAYEDLFQEGCVGLGEAIRLFDWARGHRFVTLAFPIVDGAVARQARVGSGAIDVTRHQARTLVRIRRATEDLVQVLGRPPEVEEVADRLGMRATVVRQIIDRGGGSTTGLVVDVPVQEEPSEERKPMSVDVSWLKLLGERERTILVSRFGIGMPSRSRVELARTMGVSVSTMRREELRALGMARRVLEGSHGDGRMEQWPHVLHAS